MTRRAPRSPFRLPLPARGWLRRAAFAWLLAALVLAPALGLMHRTAHGQPFSAVAGVVAGAPSAGSSDAARLVAGLFGDHGANDCRLFDQHVDAGPPAYVAVPPLAQALPQAPPAYCAPSPAARRDAPFHARAPPVLV